MRLSLGRRLLVSSCSEKKQLHESLTNDDGLTSDLTGINTSPRLVTYFVVGREEKQEPLYGQREV